MTDLRPPIDGFLDYFAVPATVTPLNSGSVVTQVIEEPAPKWVQQIHGIVVGDLRPRCAVPRTDVNELPEGSAIEATLSGRDGSWNVDRIDRIDAEFFHVVVSKVGA
jgi:hypothetical protein